MTIITSNSVPNCRLVPEKTHLPNFELLARGLYAPHEADIITRMAHAFHGSHDVHVMVDMRKNPPNTAEPDLVGTSIADSISVITVGHHISDGKVSVVL